MALLFSYSSVITFGINNYLAKKHCIICECDVAQATMKQCDCQVRLLATSNRQVLQKFHKYFSLSCSSLQRFDNSVHLYMLLFDTSRFTVARFANFISELHSMRNHRSGDLRVGDVIHSVNGTDIAKLQQRDVVALLTSSPSLVLTTHRSLGTSRGCLDETQP